MVNTSLFTPGNRRAAAVMLSLTALAGCESRHQDSSVAQAEIDKLRAAYESAVASGDPSAIAPLLAEGAVMVRPGSPDWNAMAAAAQGAPFPPGARIVIKPREVVALSAEWAYEFGTSTTTYTPPGASEPVKLHDTYLILLRNTGDGWKAYREVASAAPPPGGWPGEE